MSWENQFRLMSGGQFVAAGLWAFLGHEPVWTLMFGGLFLALSALSGYKQ